MKIQIFKPKIFQMQLSRVVCWSALQYWMHAKYTLNVLAYHVCIALCESSAVPQSLTYMDDGISNGSWCIPKDFRARLSALTRRLYLHETCTAKRRNASHFAYNRDKSLLAFRGKCRRAASRCATYSSTFCTMVVSEEIVSRYLSWGTECRELRWNRKMSLVISRWRYARLGERYMPKG